MAEAPAFNPVEYRSADGRLGLFARDYPTAKGAGSLPPLLMMHGLTRNSADFEPLIASLQPQHRVIVPDQRGRGLSEHDTDPSNYRPDVYVADMWALLDHLGVSRAILIGTSMGGLMSMIMGAQQPNRVAGMILNDIGPEVDERGLDRIRSYVGGGERAKDWAEAAQRCAAINGSAIDGFSDADWLAFAKRTCIELSDGTVKFAYDPAISQGMDEEDTTVVPPDLWPMWDTLADIPIGVLRGANSDILSAGTVAKMSDRHPGHFVQTEVSGRGHAPLLDEPKAVAMIREFLAEIE